MNASPRETAESAVSAGSVAGWGAWESGFAGRVAELAAIARCRAGAVGGTPWVVVVEGEAGIGKTALARRAVEPGADGLRVCWAQGDRSERDYPYGVVEQWLRRLTPDTAGVRELVGALAPGASPLSVGADLLGVLAAACDRAPLALVLDDAPWADDRSLKALAFVLRRLYAEPVLIVLTARSQDGPEAASPDELGGSGSEVGSHPGTEWQDVTRGATHLLPLRLTGLSFADTGAIATVAGAGGLGRAALERLYQRTSGHPLHLRSLLAQVSSEALADLTHPLPVPPPSTTPSATPSTSCPTKPAASSKPSPSWTLPPR